jgi:hypothetical protein
MCFSATASFAASGGLVFAGAASLHVAEKPQRALAAVPLIFAVQQATEGIQWLAAGAGTVCTPATYGFLFFAFLVWPIYMPFAVYMIDEERRPAMRWLLVIGAAVSAYLLVMLASQPIGVHFNTASIQYAMQVPFAKVAITFYVLATCGSLLFSSKQYAKWLGAIFLVAGVVAAATFEATAVSVWCFFAAVASASIAFFLWHENRTPSAKLAAAAR